jgi:Protein of unknown function (DUF3592)
MDGIWLVYLFLAAIPGLIIFAAVYKYIEVSQAARWPSTPGRVVVSRSEAREVSTGPNSSDTEPRNFAKIVYEYTVAGRKHRCDRVSIGENMGNFEVAETIAKYPVGKAVTVYYNPRKRSQAVLEREIPPGMWKAITIIVVVLIALIVGSIIGFRKLGDLMSGLVRDPAGAPFVTACVGFALLSALIIYAIQRNVGRMRAWPVAPGRIDASDVREFEELSTSDDHRSRVETRFRSSIVYSYEVGGVRYTGDKLGTTARVSSNIPAGARRGATRYAPGSQVDIRYNPENPAESILDPRIGPLWLLWLIPAAMLALAWFVGH